MDPRLSSTIILIVAETDFLLSNSCCVAAIVSLCSLFVKVEVVVKPHYK